MQEQGYVSQRLPAERVMRLAISDDPGRYSLCRTSPDWLLKYPERDGVTASRIIKGVLSEQDIIAAPLAPAGTRSGLARMIGGKMMALANRMGLASSSGASKPAERKEEMGRPMAGAGKSLSARLM